MCSLIAPLADLEFDRKNNAGCNENCVDPAANARHIELEMNATGKGDQTCLQNGDLNFPSIALLKLE